VNQALPVALSSGMSLEDTAVRWGLPVIAVVTAAWFQAVV